jgi:2-(1,2-epoxy-1,2-dihydrophenyl)acetyl-CoA isomerase
MRSILLKIENNIGYITLNRPEVFNSFNREMALLMQDTLDQCAKDENIRAIVITGAGKAFCAGQDLKEVTTPELMPGFRKILEEHYNPIIERIRTINKPIVAAVNGVAAGAGANIALACDIVVASEAAAFIQAFSKIGLVPDSAGTFFLPRLIGFQKASALMMLGDKVGAQEAFQHRDDLQILSGSFFRGRSREACAHTGKDAHTRHRTHQAVTQQINDQQPSGATRHGIRFAD